MAHPRSRQLEIPASVLGDPNPQELFRAWAAHERLHVIFNPCFWKDPKDWGVFLVDMARHVARAYEQEKVCSSPVALRKIKTGFEAEWRHPNRGTTAPAADVKKKMQKRTKRGARSNSDR